MNRKSGGPRREPRGVETLKMNGFTFPCCLNFQDLALFFVRRGAAGRRGAQWETHRAGEFFVLPNLLRRRYSSASRTGMPAAVFVKRAAGENVLGSSQTIDRSVLLLHRLSSLRLGARISWKELWFAISLKSTPLSSSRPTVSASSSPAQRERNREIENAGSSWTRGRDGE